MGYFNKTLEKVVVGLMAIFDATPEDVARAMKDAEYTAEEVAKGIKKAYNPSHDEIADALTYAGYNSDEIDNALLSIA